MENTLSSEFEHLRTLARAILETPADKKTQSALTYVSRSYATALKTDVQTGWFALSDLVRSLPPMISEMRSPGVRRAAGKLAEDLKRIIAPNLLALHMEKYRSEVATECSNIISNIDILEELQINSEAVRDKLPEIEEAIEKAKQSIGLAENLPDPAKQVLFGQLALMLRSIEHLQHTGVGPFRSSVFTAYGRISLELHDAEKRGLVSGEQVNDITERVLKVVGLVEAGGTILQLGHAAAKALLTYQPS